MAMWVSVACNSSGNL